MNATKSQRRGVSHTPENIHVDKRVHSGVCDTPLQVIWWNAAPLQVIWWNADIH